MPRFRPPAMLVLPALLLPVVVAIGDPAPTLINPVAPAAAPATQPAGDAALGVDSTVDQVLDALDRRGQTLDGFDAKVSLTQDDGIGLANTRIGRAMHQRLPNGDARTRVSFDQKTDGQKITDEKTEYLLSGGWLTDRDYNKRIEVRRQVLKPGDKINLFKLGDGPFPLPIGQSKEDVKKLFEVTKIRPNKDDRPGTIHLLLKPIKGTQYAKKISSMDVWVDTKTSFPQKLETIEGNSSKSTTFENLKINPPLNDGDFRLPAIPDGAWNIHEEPFKN